MRSVLNKLGLAMLGLLVCAGTSRAATISDFTIAATTTGCFGCSTFVDQPSSAPFGFDGTSFSVMTNLSGSADPILGVFSRANTNVPDDDPVPFTLKVDFTVPAGVLGNPFTFAVLLSGTNHGGGGDVFVDFADNTFHTYSFDTGTATGSFDFAVLDIGSTSTTGGLSKDGTANLLGQIRNAQLTTPDTQATVPEPASMLLVGGGLAGLVARRYRRRRP